ELSPNSELPSLLPETKVVRLAVTRIALEIAQGHDEVALARWGKETTFLLNQARNSYGLIDKMVAIANLNRYQNILADYIYSRPEGARIDANKIMAMLLPFNNEAVTLQPAFRNNSTLFARYILSLKQIQGYGLISNSIDTPGAWLLDK